MNAHSENFKFLENMAHHSARWAGSPWAYLVAVGCALLWLISGPFMNFSNSWEMIMRAAGGTMTFIMVFLIQRSQNKDSLAMQIKLNEIIAALHGANNRMISIEDLSEGEIHSLQKDYQMLATHINKDQETSTHSVSMEDVIKLEKELGTAITETIASQEKAAQCQ